MKYELFPLRASKVSVEDTNTELRLKDIDEEEIIVILPDSLDQTFEHDKRYKLTIERIYDDSQNSV